jgi:SPP1 family predicted phage head-tail adaptor
MLTCLRNTITIQSLTVTPSGGGTFSEAWTTTSTAWARVEGVAAEETRFDKIQQVEKYTIRMRKQPLSNTQRILYLGKVLDIESVLDETQLSRMMTVKARCEI